VRARFIGGVKDKVVIHPWPDPPPPYWNDDDGDYELFAIVREGEEALYKVSEGPKPESDNAFAAPREAQEQKGGWRWVPQRNRPGRIRPRPVRAVRRLPRARGGR
jgi:hypothetical protein